MCSRILAASSSRLTFVPGYSSFSSMKSFESSSKHSEKKKPKVKLSSPSEQQDSKGAMSDGVFHTFLLPTSSSSSSSPLDGRRNRFVVIKEQCGTYIGARIWYNSPFPLSYLT